MEPIDEIRTLIAVSSKRDRIIDATEIALSAQAHNPTYTLGELVSMVVEEVATLPSIR